jgi:predicted nuclease of predicted toxin-antitoxin system
VKLLFDQNLSSSLIRQLSDLFPSSSHVSQTGLGNSDDKAVWEYAKTNEYVIVTKDADYSELSVTLRFPPKVIWIRRGNCSTRQIAELLRNDFEFIRQLETDENLGVVSVY